MSDPAQDEEQQRPAAPLRLAPDDVEWREVLDRLTPAQRMGVLRIVEEMRARVRRYQAGQERFMLEMVKILIENGPPLRQPERSGL